MRFIVSFALIVCENPHQGFALDAATVVWEVGRAGRRAINGSWRARVCGSIYLDHLSPGQNSLESFPGNYMP
jgi:hypothetical protein